MMARQQIGAWLAQWGSQVGVRLALDARGECAFVAEGLQLQVNVSEAGDTVLLAGVLASQDIGTNASALKALLSFGHLGGPSNRCGVSLTPSGRPAMWLWLNGGTLDAAQLSNALTGFIATARAGREALAGVLSPSTGAPGTPVDLAFVQRV